MKGVPVPSGTIAPSRARRVLPTAPKRKLKAGLPIAPRLYYVNPRLAGPLAGWPGLLERIAGMGFSGVLLAWPFGGTTADPLATDDPDRLHPALGYSGDAAEGVAMIAAACRAHGLALLLDIVIDRAASGGRLAASLPGCWAEGAGWIDPRDIGAFGVARLMAGTPESQAQVAAFWAPRLPAWQDGGVTGMRFHAVEAAPLGLWSELLAPLRARDPNWISIGWLTGRPREEALAAAEVFDMLPSSVAWWDGGAPWLAEEYRALRPHTRLLAHPEDPFGPRLIPTGPGRDAATHRRALHAASLLANGWLMPMGFEYGARLPFLAATADAEDFAALREDAPFDLSGEIAEANARLAALPTGAATLRQLTGEAAPVTLMHRAGRSDGVLVALNNDLHRVVQADLRPAAAQLGGRVAGREVELPPGGGAAVALETAAPVLTPALTPVTQAARIAIEAVTPAVEAGRFAAKRIVGETVAVSADIFADGHEVLGAELRWRAADSDTWQTAAMRELGNDRWQSELLLERPGRHVFAIVAWWDHFATFRRDLGRKHEAGLDLALEIEEGRLLLEHSLDHAADEAVAVIRAHLAALPADPVATLLAPSLAEAMRAADPRPHATGADRHFPVEADREAARFASWYELFPRSATDSVARHGTFRDVIARLPAIRDMGFDVLYFPPIHPIGRTNRKGPNNTLTPGPDDPGSPYAIGGEAGGHDAFHPDLGTAEDFRALVAAAAEHGLEIALDFAIQCAPDHPWLREHPDWFQWRPDGSIKYAENPPKKYQDIVNVDFYAEGATPALWLALRDVVRFWVGKGVRIFRVDNPHTKPFPFWEWLIADIRAEDPGVLFLAEAFTRPKVMYRLGKVGFSQSYTYFTWRNEKAELAAYMQELNEAPARDVFRPNFFVNTPDINPVFLQTGGRPGFLIRAALAATLSGLWGVYSGFEICEAAALPGREEYLDSEKYQIRVRDYAAPGNIVTEITRLNQIRRSHPALQSHLGLSFYHASSEHILFFGKRQPGTAEMVLVAVNLDPHVTHDAAIEVPLWEFGLPDHASLTVEDLMNGRRFTWTGKHQSISLDPVQTPFCIWRIAPAGESA
jgi:starch synthase (maltosyl-transferring)